MKRLLSVLLIGAIVGFGARDLIDCARAQAVLDRATLIQALNQIGFSAGRMITVNSGTYRVDALSVRNPAPGAFVVEFATSPAGIQ